MSELKDYKVYTTRHEGAWGYHYEPNPNKDQSDIELNGEQVYLKKDADKVIAEKDGVIAELKADYKEACDRLQTANLIKDEQKAKADKLLSCLKYLVMGDLIKDCPPKKVATEIVKEYDNGLGTN
jgi:hypothetical protein